MKKRKKRTSFARLARYYVGSGHVLVIFVCLMLLFSTVTDILAPKIVQQIMDSLSLGELSFQWEAAGKLLFCLIVLYVFGGVFLGGSRRLQVIVSENMVSRLRNSVQKKLEILPLNYLDTHKRGDILACATNDMVMLTNVMQTNLPSILTSLLKIVGTLVMMLFTNVQLSLIFFIMMPLSFFAMKTITKNTRKLFKKQQNVLGELNSHIEESITGSDVMRAFNFEEESYCQLEAINKKFFSTYLWSRTLSGLINPVMTLLNNMVYIAICVFGSYSILQGNLTIGGLSAFLIYANNISGPINQFSAMLNQVQAGLAASERVFQLLDEEPEVQDPVEAAGGAGQTQGSVDFDHVKFGYTPERILMHDVSFHVDPGQVFAIVGPSGAGKTTLVNLLMRFYEINGGTIRLDGCSIRDMTRHDLRRFMGMVLQDTWIFSGTVFENIAYGKPGATMEEVQEAARKAQCDNFIRRLPDGYETMINAESSALSAGEKQLLAIARVVIAEPAILILDEATSNIDTRTEVLITKAMNDMMKGRTTFIIAHRLFTIKNADSIIFMKDGDILEIGTHRELMEKGGHYAELYNSSYA